MARINLLPWREARRKEQQKNFVSTALFSAALAAVLVGFVHIQVNGVIDYQQRRNKFLENEIKILDNKIKEIKKLESTKKALIERMNVIKNLQATRPGIVHLFDELVRTLPDGVYLSGVKQSENTLNISGKAESNARVSAYMRNIDESDWFKNPTLSVIESKDAKSGRISSFKLRAIQTAPKDIQQEKD
ncbi:MAG: PilN domain-containing protein [Pseudomonadota bacterium]